ncbi:hypothetical protein [Streptomyces sp. SID3343]|uniref:hypothetical protein n=1 Tax=Streptomyces sp. SID3343 TaxID=2690260 RepID=UPI0013721C3D|nr:hypothetical protein [Streptomyces sp. SID3343]MYV97358.1 hypothetical protein [Streptomyces sp. SID3343]
MADDDFDNRPVRGDSTHGIAITDGPPNLPAPPRISAPDVRNGIAFATAGIVFVFVALSGLVIWAAASLDGGIPGVTAPARHRPDQQDPPAAPRTIEPITTQGQAAPGAPPAAATPQTTPLAASRGRLAAGPTEAQLAQATFPLDCPGVATDRARVLTDPNGPTVVQVACHAGSGSPPAALLAYDTDESGAPRLAATLLAADEGLLVSDVTRQGDTVTAHTLGWSDPDGPRCCPDVDKTIRWKLTPTGADRS